MELTDFEDSLLLVWSKNKLPRGIELEQKTVIIKK
jgi:hypothetical protein